MTITPSYKGLFPSQAQLIMVSGKYGPCIAYALLLLCPIFKKKGSKNVKVNIQELAHTGTLP